MKIIFFFSNINNQKNNHFVNNLLDKLQLNDIVKINVDSRNIKIQTPSLQVNNKIMGEKESLIFLAKYQKENNKQITNIEQPKNELIPNTYDNLEMNNFSDSYSFIGDNNPLMSK